MKALALALALLPVIAFGQTDAKTASPTLTKVSIDATGTDVKTVLHSLFSQAKKSYVIQPNTWFALHLKLDDMDFDEALVIVCHTAGLESHVQDGIYFITRPVKKPATSVADSVPARTMLAPSVLTRKVTTKLNKATIADVFAELGKQADVKFELEKGIPAVRLDVFLNKTSLRYALEKVSKAVDLKFQFTDHGTIQISPIAHLDAVTISKD